MYPDPPGNHEWNLPELRREIQENRRLGINEKERRELRFIYETLLNGQERRRKPLDQEQKNAVWWVKDIVVLRLDFWALNAQVRGTAPISGCNTSRTAPQEL